ncbi:MAG: HU family DNA-binding protein, partial [Tannerellaceae bacterium]|nr:HU family DNA-binding protein [Tannerellaceae bacterium]
MDNRLTIEEIAGLLAQSTGKEKEIIEQFLKEFVFVVRDYIFADRIVMIKGIGVFKIIQVDKRESIDVNTQERIVIPAHYKLSYLPEKEIREQVNKPFSFFETIEVGEDAGDGPIVPVDDDASEKEDDTEEGIEPGEETTIVEEEIVEEEIVGQEIVEQEIIEEKVEETNETEEIEEQEEIKETIEEININNKERKANMNENQMYPDDTSSTREVRNEIDGMKRLLIVLLACVIALIVAVVIGLFVFFIDKGEPTPTQTTEVVAPPVTTEPPAEPNSFDLPSDGGDLLSGDESEEDVPDLLDSDSDIPDILATVKVRKGDRLNLLALDYYGHKDFWVYIYQYNKSLLDDPDNLPVGVKLQIPSSRLYDINANSSASLKKARALQSQILSKYRRRTSYSPAQHNPGCLPPCAPGILATVKVQRGDGLYSLAREYYGNKDFWVYIYQYNKHLLEDPNTLPTGINLQIPCIGAYKENYAAYPQHYYCIPDILTTVKVRTGDRLNTLARDYYGNKDFWVYIYQHNKNILDHPDRIPVGVKLQIPSAKLYDIHAGSPASIKKARALQAQ